jgi:hypothetical protein
MLLSSSVDIHYLLCQPVRRMLHSLKFIYNVCQNLLDNFNQTLKIQKAIMTLLIQETLIRHETWSVSSYCVYGFMSLQISVFSQYLIKL